MGLIKKIIFLATLGYFLIYQTQPVKTSWSWQKIISSTIAKFTPKTQITPFYTYLLNYC